MPSVGSTLSIHRSTQTIALAYLIKTMDLEKRNQSITHIVDILKNYMREAYDQGKFPTTKCLLTHCEVFLSHNNLFSENSYGVIIGELGGLYFLLSDHINAKKRLEQSLSILENPTCKDPSLLFRPLSYLGYFYWGIGEFTKARALLEKGVEIYKKFEIADEDGICQTLTWAGMLFANGNDLQKAKNLFTEAVKIYEKSPSKNYQGLAASLMQLGNLYRTLGEYNKAEFYLQKSIALSEKYLTANHPTLGDALGHLGWLYGVLGYLEIYMNEPSSFLNNITHIIILW
jgi:tetratricopeptide (TPR) repeat protein